MATLLEAAPMLGVVATCAAFSVARATYYRHVAPMFGPKLKRPSPPRRLDDGERQSVLAVLHEPRFVDLAPAEVFATLLEAGEYLCSLRTMHRIQIYGRS
jgi:putative transposase